MDYTSALAYIHAVQWVGHKPGLTRTRTLLAALGDPHKQLRFVHVAGTNGKGSTVAMLSACLQAAGYRVGMFTSPFINRFNERIQINGQSIPDQDLVALVERIRPTADSMADVPTEFELITALGMLYFAQQHCDIVVLEVGLGGTLDSTNVIDPPECAVITALGLDHTQQLGPTLSDIAAAKAGIIKEGSPVVSYGGVPEADTVIAAAAAAHHAPLTTVDLSRLHIRQAGLDQVEFDFDGLEHLTLPLPHCGPCAAGAGISRTKPSARAWPQCAGPAGSSCCAPPRPLSWMEAIIRTGCRPRPRACGTAFPGRNSSSWSASWPIRT